MYNNLYQLKKLCDIVFTITNLDVELLDIDLQRILLLTYNTLPFTLTDHLQNYYQNLESHLGHLNHSACYLHEWPEYSLVFLDMRIQISADEAYYISLGPVLSEIYNDSFVSRLMKKLELPQSSRISLTDFYKQLSFFNAKAKEAFCVSYYVLSTLPDFSDITFLRSPDVHLSKDDIFSSFFAEHMYPISEELQLNYESELKWRNAVSRGDSRAAKKALAKMSSNEFLYRTPSDPFRTIKNVLLSENALCRAAAIDGGASPLSVHKLHEAYSLLIESVSTTIETEKIEQEIFDDYCNLVISSHTQDYSPVVANAVQYLYSHYEMPLSLHLVAKAIHCSEGHLSRIFQKETGRTLGVYLNELRIEQAISLLKLNFYNITDIALQVGFSSYTKFSIEFKKYTGMCASDYLRKV